MVVMLFGQNTIRNVVKELMKKANIDGFFTNHSLHCTGSTRLFQAGINCKLVKAATGHCSDAVDLYQVMIDQQGETMSKIITSPQSVSENSVRHENPTPKRVVEQKETNVTCNVGEMSSNRAMTSVCTCGLKANNVGDIVNSLIEKTKLTTRPSSKFKLRS